MVPGDIQFWYCRDSSVISCDRMNADVEDLVILNGKTKFESFNVAQCLEGMKNHQRHNGVQLDGLRRLTDLCKQGEPSHAWSGAELVDPYILITEKNSLYLILTDQWMRSLILPITERYQSDNRVQSLLYVQVMASTQRDCIYWLTGIKILHYWHSHPMYKLSATITRGHLLYWLANLLPRSN